MHLSEHKWYAACVEPSNLSHSLLMLTIDTCSQLRCSDSEALAIARAEVVFFKATEFQPRFNSRLGKKRKKILSREQRQHGTHAQRKVALKHLPLQVPGEKPFCATPKTPSYGWLLHTQFFSIRKIHSSRRMQKQDAHLIGRLPAKQ